MKILGYELERPDYIFVAVSLLLLYLNFSFLSDLKQIPSPPYGGDYYNGLGGVLHIIDGGSVFESAQMLGELPWVPWLYHLSVAVFSLVTGLEPWAALVYFSMVVQILSLVVIYFLIIKITGDKYISLFAPVLFTAYFPIFKYSSFSTWLIVPTFVLSLYLFMENQNLKRAVLAGITLGLMGLSNTQAFFLGFMIFGIFALVFLLPKLKEKIDVGLIKPYAAVFLIGFLISLLFWFWPLFVYKGQTLNPIQDITSPDMRNPVYLWNSIGNLLNSSLFPLSSGITIVFTFLNLVGLSRLRNIDDRNNRFVLVLVAALLISILHPLITIPLFGLQIMNFMMIERLLPTVSIILFALGAKYVSDKLEDKNHMRKILAFGLVLVALSYSMSNMESMKSDQWIQYGKTELSPPLMELSDWIRANTGVDDVFLTTNEGGFMMNALTGRKVVSYRRAHASPYTDMDRRMADQAVMVYGSDPAELNKLLEEYDVKYVLWSNRWMFDEFQFNEQGQLLGFFDPLTVPDEPEYRQYWDRNGVAYLNLTMSLDPAPREGVPLYDVLVALPTEPTFENPYSIMLADRLVLVKTISYEGADYFKIYEVRKS